jgi:hypothetical protein
MWPLAAALLFLQAALCAAAPEGSPAAANADAGALLSVMESAQLNFGKLDIGAAEVGSGPYLDEKGARRQGLHANLSIAVQGQPSQFSQPSVHEGEILEVAGYRISVEKINPGQRGTVVMRLWGPPKPSRVNKGWLQNMFGL